MYKISVSKSEDYENFWRVGITTVSEVTEELGETATAPDAAAAVLLCSAFAGVLQTRAPVSRAVGALGPAQEMNQSVGAARARDFLKSNNVISMFCELFVLCK